MRRTSIIILLLALAWPAPAAIYQCRDADGNLFITDDPDNLPPGCRQEDITVREETVEKNGRDATLRGRPATEGREAPASEPPGPGTDAAPPPVAAEPGSPAAGREPETAPPEAESETAGEQGEAGGAAARDEMGEGEPATTGLDREAPAEEEAAGEESAVAAPSGRTEEPDVSAASQGVLGRWREEARQLGREYLQTETGTAGETLAAADRRQQVEEEIDQFLNRLDASSLTPEEKAAIWQEIPPQAIR